MAQRKVKKQYPHPRATVCAYCEHDYRAEDGLYGVQVLDLTRERDYLCQSCLIHLENDGEEFTFPFAH